MKTTWLTATNSEVHVKASGKGNESELVEDKNGTWQANISASATWTNSGPFLKLTVILKFKAIARDYIMNTPQPSLSSDHWDSVMNPGSLYEHGTPTDYAGWNGPIKLVVSKLKNKTDKYNDGDPLDWDLEFSCKGKSLAPAIPPAPPSNLRVV